MKDRPDADPSVTELVRMIEEGEITAREIYENTYLSMSTIKRYMNQITRKPMGLTVRGIANAIGVDIVFVKRKRGK